MKVLTVGACLGLVLILAGSPIALAKTNPFANWQIYYYNSTDHSCTGGFYTNTVKDGGGFATNQPSNNNNDPIVNGASIDVKIVATGSTSDATVFYEVDSIFGPITLGSLDGSGNGTFCFTVTLPTDVTSCHTSPQKIALNSNTQGAFDGNIIDHFITGTGCTASTTTTVTATTGSCPPQGCPPPPNVPEFPLGILPMLVFAIPLLVLLGRRFAVRPVTR
jgi:hypothetical protein